MALTILVLATMAAAAGAGVVVLHARLRLLREQAVTDPLTGAFNRRQMYVILDAAADRRRRSGERASLLVFDIDRFKDLNDAFGHVEGDRVLKGLVELAGKRFRKLDALFRIGGEEFALLLSGTGFIDALDAAEEFRALVQGAGFLPEYQVSISIGVVELAFEQSVMDWIEEADSALYRAKRNGRNRVAGSARQRSRGALTAERSRFAGAVN